MAWHVIGTTLFTTNVQQMTYLSLPNVIIGCVFLVVIGLFLFWVENWRKKLKANQFAYKVKGSGVEKLFSIVYNPWAQRQVLIGWKIRLGLLKPLSLGSRAPGGKLVGLDGLPSELVQDCIQTMPPGMPLILNIGSYN